MRLSIWTTLAAIALLAISAAQAQENIDCGYPLNNNERTYCAEKALKEANSKMETAYEKLHAKVVEMRYFAGLSVKETAHVLDVSERTVKNDWRAARAWLLARLQADGG